MSSVVEVDLSSYHEFAVSLALRAGKVIKDAFYAPSKEITFKASIDLVTKTDKEVELLIMREIRRFPGHRFVGEEDVSSGESKEELTDEPTWLVDPIDGTTNFVHKFPHCAVSIGFALKKQVVVGVVYNPILNDLFTAIKGKGAKRNGVPISVSTTDNLQHSLIATGFPYDRTRSPVITALLCQLLYKIRDMRRAGSAALDMCYVAAGIYEGYYEEGIHAWDVAAGSLIVEEAGGRVGSLDGLPFDMCKRQVLATNKGIYEELAGIVRKGLSSSKL